MSLQDGLNALQKQQFEEAVQLLETFCHESSDRQSPFYIQAQMALARAYRGNGQSDKASALCQSFSNHANPEVSEWAKSFLTILAQDGTPQRPSSESAHFSQKAGRVEQAGVKLIMPKLADSLAFASSFTVALLLGMVLVLSLGIFFIVDNDNPGLGLTISIFITLIVNGLAFFISPWIMDLTQQWLYQTRWVSLAEIQRYSPEAAETLLRVCRERQIRHPKLGIIDDQNPTAFTYGSLPSNARIVVSQGLFTYLDADEIAAVYAHELGHIAHWDFAVMTVASTLVQITYLIYLFAREIGAKSGRNNKIKDALSMAAVAAYVFYLMGTYLVLYLSRTREYYADHFAAETTGNPNGLSRALVKIAYGILEETQKSAEPSRLIEGTRALGIYDPKAAATAGTAYRITSESQRIGRVFLWDLFNPWATWMELNSTHPLTGKRIRALTTYAEQMGLDTEFNMAAVIREGHKLNQGKLWGNFLFEAIVGYLQWLGGIAGLLMGLLLAVAAKDGTAVLGVACLGFGGGLILRTLLLYPDFERSPETDVFTLMCDPYASPVRGRPVRLTGEAIGRGDAGYRFGSDLKFQDRTGMLFARYASRFGALGNFFFGWTQVQSLIGTPIIVVGWFRRGVAPWLDLVQLSNNQTTVNSYHRFWSLLLGMGAIVLGIVLPMWLRGV